MDDLAILPGRPYRVFGGVNLAKNSVTGRGRMFQSTCVALERGVLEQVRQRRGTDARVPVVRRQANGKVSAKWYLAQRNKT